MALGIYQGDRQPRSLLLPAKAVRNCSIKVTYLYCEAASLYLRSGGGLMPAYVRISVLGVSLAGSFGAMPCTHSENCSLSMDFTQAVWFMEDSAMVSHLLLVVREERLLITHRPLNQDRSALGMLYASMEYLMLYIPRSLFVNRFSFHTSYASPMSQPTQPLSPRLLLKAARSDQHQSHIQQLRRREIKY